MEVCARFWRTSRRHNDWASQHFLTTLWYTPHFAIHHPNPRLTPNSTPVCQPIRDIRYGIKWFRLTPNGTNPGLFRVRFQKILAQIWKNPGVPLLGPIWPTFDPNLTALQQIICKSVEMSHVEHHTTFAVHQDLSQKTFFHWSLGSENQWLRDYVLIFVKPVLFFWSKISVFKRVALKKVVYFDNVVIYLFSLDEFKYLRSNKFYEMCVNKRKIV